MYEDSWNGGQMVSKKSGENLSLGREVVYEEDKKIYVHIITWRL